MASDLHPWQAKIDSFLDAELPAEEARALQAHLGECAVCARRVVEGLQLKRAVHSAGKRYLPSAEFRRRLQRRVAVPGRRWWGWQWAAALGAVAVIVVTAYISLSLWSQPSRSQQLLAELADLHVTSLAASTPVDVASSDRHTVKPWFQGKLPFTFNLPALAGSPFTLVGGRLVYFQHEPGAQLIYNLRSHHISVFIFRDRPQFDRAFPSPDSTAGVLAFHLHSWTAGGLRYFVFADADLAEMRQLSDLLRKAATSDNQP